MAQHDPDFPAAFARLERALLSRRLAAIEPVLRIEVLALCAVVSARLAGGGSGVRSGSRRLAPRAACAWLAALALCALPPLAGAGTPPSRTQILLTECPSRESLRARLLVYADSALPSSPTNAAEALYYAGQSYARASVRDSAILCFRRSASAEPTPDARLALADALLKHRREGDLEAALEVLEAPAQEAGGDAFRARLAWAELLAGRPERANQLFRPLETQLDLDPVWGYRMARAFVEVGDVKRALKALQPLAIASRAQDEEIMSLAGRAFERFGDRSRLETNIGREISFCDQDEGKLAQRLGARRVRFSAEDGYALGGVVAAPAGDQRRRAAVMLWAPHDTLESYDSLSVALNRAGFSVLFMQVRGSGWSATPACPFPEAWEGREDAMQAICARDVRDGLRALSLAASIDTARYVVAGVGSTAPIAVEAAELDDRIAALLLLSPKPADVERGTMRERIRRLQRPIYFSNAPEDFPQFELTETLYQSGDRPRSRVADVKSAGSGARPFRRDPPAVARLVRWLEETMPARGSKSGNRHGR